MPKYTVQCGYNTAYGNTAVVEAADPAAASEAAIAAVNDCSAWRAHDDVGPTYVDAIAEGDDVDPWLDGARSQLPIPARYTERAVTGSYLSALAIIGGYARKQLNITDVGA